MAKKTTKTRAAAEAAGEAILAQQASPSMGQRVADQTVCLTLRRGRFGNRRQASLSTVTTDADKALIGLRKTLLVSPELTAITSLDGEATAYLDRIRLPAPYKFTAYTYLLALQTVEEVDAALRGFQARRGAGLSSRRRSRRIRPGCGKPRSGWGA